MSAHTPGPWRVVSTADQSKYSKHWREIAPGIVGATSYETNRWGEMEYVPGVNISEANANLIAAAPELLAALEAFLDYSLTDGGNPSLEDAYRAQARAAIAKAKGQP